MNSKSVAQHTSAPWTLEDNENEPCQLIGNSTIHIADIYMTDFPAGMADARLIAAAPELLNALELAEATIERLERVHAIHSVHGTLDVMRAAMDKARGE